MKAKRKQTRVILNSRDIEILQFLFEHKISSREQIGRFFFEGKSTTVVNRRLKKLESIGLLQRKVLWRETSVTYHCFSLTRKGVQELNPRAPYKISGRELKSDCVFHDMALAEICRVLKKRRQMKLIYPENVLQNCEEFHDDYEYRHFVKYNTDIFVRAEYNGEDYNFAFEYEASRKSAARYKARFHEYYYADTVNSVFYICKTKSLLQYLQGIDEQVRKENSFDHKFAFATLDDILSNESETIFKIPDGREVRFV